MLKILCSADWHINLHKKKVPVDWQTSRFREMFRKLEVQTDNLPTPVPGDILVTHIRGEVPPHITPEYDFSRLKPWGLCLLGDLHFNHRYHDTNCYYPGSPLNTTFDRTML
jgi:hypothetical protein